MAAYGFRRLFALGVGGAAERGGEGVELGGRQVGHGDVAALTIAPADQRKTAARRSRP